MKCVVHNNFTKTQFETFWKKQISKCLTLKDNEHQKFCDSLLNTKEIITYISSRKPLLEIKHSFIKPTIKFYIENWNFEENEVCVGRYVEKKESNYNLPLNSYSWGIWWKNKDIGVYRIHAPNHNIIGYRFDMIQLPTIFTSEVEQQPTIIFNDLIADIWIFPRYNANSVSKEYICFVEDIDELYAASRMDTLNNSHSDSCAAVDIDVRHIMSRIDDILLDPDEILHEIDTTIEKAISLRNYEVNTFHVQPP